MSPAKAVRQKRDADIYAEWTELAADPDKSRTAIAIYLMEKYGLFSRGTLYSIIRRMESRNNPANGSES